MEKIVKDIHENHHDAVSLDKKMAVLKEIGQEEIISLFKKKYDKNTQYKQILPKKIALDQQVAISIDLEEKRLIEQELYAIRQHGERISVSNFIRSRGLALIDINDWHDIVKNALIELGKSEWQPNTINMQKAEYMRQLDDATDKETEFFLKEKIEELNGRLQSLKRNQVKRAKRVASRFTYQEANVIRWRAARLSLPVADYMRFVLFGHVPYSQADAHLSLEARKRFYISVLDVCQNGWGEPPQVNECPNCARYLKENAMLKEKIARYEMLLKSK